MKPIRFCLQWLLILLPLGLAAEPLTEERLIKLVRANHPVLERARLDLKRAEAKRLEKQGAFDARVGGGTRFLRYNSSAGIGQVQKVLESRFSVDFLTRYGIGVSTGFKRAAGDIKTPVKPTGEDGEYFLELTVPLLRGLGQNPKAAAESQAFLGEDQALLKLRRTELKLLQDALSNYWAWVGAKRKLEVEERLLRLAKVRVEAIEHKIASGLLPKINLVEAQREVQRRLGRVLKAERTLQKTAFKLGLFLWQSPLQPAPVPEMDQIPPSVPEPANFTRIQLESGKLSALEGRPELQALDLAQELAAIDRELARNQLLPRLDLVLSQGYQTGDDAIEGPVIKAGVKMSLPVLRRAAKGRLQQAMLTLSNLDLQKKQSIQAVMIEVADWFSQINATYERYLAARRELEFARKLEQGEKDAFTLGDSTLFLVNRRERATGEAHLKLIDILVEYHQAIAGFKAATAKF